MDTSFRRRQPDAHVVPDILQEAPYRNLPLHMLVAWWVYRQTSPVSVREVSEAFHISARRAGDLLLYLMNSVSHVQCTRVWQAIPGGGRRRVWTVLRIGDLPPRRPVTAPVPVRKSPPARRRAPSPAIRDLRAWMVSRRPGETLPVEDTGTLSDGEVS
ncbi:CaiF/GrlA family transcriptional regulator [Salmonella enterica]|nr:CaiF/GrlA family transcriptional regulator [Salmonella enterica]EED6375636.1 CaiF/GrlA family transcriptional regulator [Salmonella enterica subsp. enterica serovar Give]EBH7970098.1 CaiF/GrlA family transcriptional regulator [Salmonella enterica]EBK0440130.1 CaiF/GrlA family transcriptional regulator [Salmonella enterica]EJS5667201.1 CaiF/GrlA family transcriptional regulator [Salmonella enterica]